MIELRQKFHFAVTSEIFVRSASKFHSFDFLFTFLKQKKYKNDYFMWTPKYGERYFHSDATSPIFVRLGPVGSSVVL